jgi:hypothetical protein
LVLVVMVAALNKKVLVEVHPPFLPLHLPVEVEEVHLALAVQAG